MAYAAVLKQMASDLLVVTFTGPNRLDALTHRMCAESLEFVRNAEEKNTARTNLCSGADGEAFCTGADLPQPKPQRLFRRRELLPTITIQKSARLNGSLDTHATISDLF